MQLSLFPQIEPSAKRCSKCATEKDRSEFQPDIRFRDGLNCQCRACRNAYSAKWQNLNRELYRERTRAQRAKNPEKHRARYKAWVEKDVEFVRETKRKWSAANADKRKASSAKYLQAHKAEAAARTRKRTATKIKALRAWADVGIMDDIYRLARIWSDATGERYEVDHIIPIRSDVVCGFHCEANLQILTRRENRRKSNRWWPDMP